MKAFLNGMAYIAEYFKKYKFSLIFVMIFILIVTYLQVLSPKVLGSAIDSLVTPTTIQVTCDDDSSKECDKVVQGFVIENIKYDGLQEVYTSIEKGNGLPQDLRDSLSSSKDKNVQALLNTSNKDLKTQLSNFKALKIAFDKDKTNASKGILTQPIIDSIKSSRDIEDSLKTMLTYNKDSLREDLINMGFAESGVDFIIENLETYNPTLYKQVQAIQDFQSPDNIKKLYDQTNNIIIDQTNLEQSEDVFIHNIINLVIIYVLLSICYFTYMVIMSRTSAKTTRDMRVGLFEKIEHLSIRFFDKTPDGDLLSRFINDMDNISNAMNQSLTQVISQFAMLIGIIIMMFHEDNTYYEFANGFVLQNLLTWIMIAFAIVAIVAALIIVRFAQYHISRQQGKLANLNDYIDEKINGQKLIVSYGMQSKIEKGFDVVNEDFRETATKGQIYSALLMPTVNGLGVINLAFIVFIGSLFISNGSGLVTVGLIVAFTNYSQRFFQPLAQIFSMYSMVQLGLTGANRVSDIFDEQPEILNKENALKIKGIDGSVNMKNVSFAYDQDKPVLKNINIDVKKGQMVALVGPTGSGKTTVMNLMNRFYDVSKGSIQIDGNDIRDIDLSSLRENIGIVLQESVLFTGTIHENIGYSKKKVSREKVKQAAKLSGLHEYIESLEKGYDTVISNDTTLFSTGQKQMMSIARTLLSDPDLLILDEATSNVDTVTEEKIQFAMSNALKGRTSFVIAHRLKTILEADIIVVLKDGKVIEQGSHKELLKQKGFYAELYYNQFVID